MGPVNKKGQKDTTDNSKTRTAEAREKQRLKMQKFRKGQREDPERLEHQRAYDRERKRKERGSKKLPVMIGSGFDGDLVVEDSRIATTDQALEKSPTPGKDFYDKLADLGFTARQLVDLITKHGFAESSGKVQMYINGQQLSKRSQSLNSVLMDNTTTTTRETDADDSFQGDGSKGVIQGLFEDLRKRRVMPEEPETDSSQPEPEFFARKLEQPGEPIQNIFMGQSCSSGTSTANITRDENQNGLTYQSNCKPRSLWNASFEMIHEENIARDNYVNSPIFLPDGRFIYATCFSDEEIVLMDSDLSQTLSKLELERCANDICVMSNTEVIIMQKNQYLQFINVLTNELTLGEKIDLGDDVFCYSIDVLKGEIYIVCVVEKSLYVRILDRHGQVRKQIRISIFEYESIVKIKVGRSGDKIFLSFNDSSRIVCLSIVGHVLFTFPNDKTGHYGNEFMNPIDMYVDNNDHVLVSCCDSDKIHLINSDGTQYKVLIEAQEASDRLIGNFSYRESDGCLVVENAEELLVYKASW